jgi:hypothetical protein
MALMNSDTYSLLDQTLGCLWLRTPDHCEVLSCLQCLEPDIQTKNQRENSADDRHVSVDLEPSACIWHDYCWDGEEECDEDKNRVPEGSYFSISLLLFYATSLLSIPLNGHIPRSKSFTTLSLVNGFAISI